MKLHYQKLRLLMFIASAIYNTRVKAEPLKENAKPPVM